MRNQGRLVEWFDDKGYGFIQPNDLTKDRVFLHIKAFSRPGPRPILGCALEYDVVVDGKGRFQAQKVYYLKASQSKQHSVERTTQITENKKHPLQIASVIYIISLALLTVFGVFQWVWLLGVLIINFITYWCYVQDKTAAQIGAQRIPEKTFHVLAFLGGWPAAHLAQQKYRHKTQKQQFRNVYFCMIVLNIMFVLWLISPLNTF